MMFSVQLFPGNSSTEVHYVIQVELHKNLLKYKQCGISQWLIIIKKKNQKSLMLYFYYINSNSI